MIPLAQLSDTDEAAVRTVGTNTFNWPAGRLRYLMALVQCQRGVGGIARMMGTDRGTIRRKIDALRAAGADIRGEML